MDDVCKILTEEKEFITIGDLCHSGEYLISTNYRRTVLKPKRVLHPHSSFKMFTINIPIQCFNKFSLLNFLHREVVHPVLWIPNNYCQTTVNMLNICYVFILLYPTLRSFFSCWRWQYMKFYFQLLLDLNRF